MFKPKLHAQYRNPGTSIMSGMGQQGLVESYDNYSHPIYHIIFRQVGEVETSREITSEVVNKLLKIITGKTVEINFIRARLNCAVQNLVVDHYRRWRHKPHVLQDETLMKTPMKTDEKVEQRITADNLREAILQLSPDQRQVVLLIYLKGMTNQETADIMGMTVGMVKSLKRRALNALRKILLGNKEILPL